MSAKRLVFLGLALALGLGMATAVCAQSPTSGLVSGTVADPSGAVVPGAQVTLVQRATNASQSTTTDAAGRYAFPAVIPGDYTLNVLAKGFRTTEIPDVHVEVLKTVTLNITVQLGASTQTVEVTSTGTNAELQTTDATVGTELEGVALQRLPAFTRSASSLMFLQPGVTPALPMSSANAGGNDTLGGQMAGARSEQITISLDGGDVTSDLEGSDAYISPPGEPQPAPIVPIPTESTEEFRVDTSNPEASFNRSSGGQVALVTKHGTNSLHGSVYEYHNDDALNGNTWTNDTFDINKPHSVDNRFGATAGGPIWKDRIFIFGGYEARRFHDATGFNVIVPTESMKQGILTFPNAAGQPVQYNLKTADLCGTSGNTACDPRGIGLSPVIASQFGLYPAGNNTGLGDGFNTTGYFFNLPTPISEDIGVLRMDFKVTNKWSVFATYHTADVSRVGTEQISFINGQPKSVSTDPFYPGFVSFQVTGQITPMLTSVTHGSYLHNWWGWDRQVPTPLVPGTAEALELAGEGTGQANVSAAAGGKLVADPININTQQARGRIWNGHDWYIAQDFSLVHGNHLFQFGGNYWVWNDDHLRTDDVLGGLTSAPINYVEAVGNGNGTFMKVGSAFEPPTCGAGAPSNCLVSGASPNWDQLYASVLGLVDRDAQVATFSGTFQANPLGTPLFDNVHIPSFYTYFQDVYKIRPSVTITAGLNWGVQLTPSESQGKEVVLTYASDNEPVNYYQFLAQRGADLQSGNFSFNPQFGLTPVRFLPAPLHNEMRFTDWHDVSPRISVAWNVPYHNWLFGENNETVIRGGYGLMFDRTSAVTEVLLPLLAGGLADVQECGGPLRAGGCSTPGAVTTPNTAFRIGVDGSSVPIPAPANQPVPFIPASGFSLFLAAPLDPYATPGYSHNIDLTIQRALPNKMLFEIGYIGRMSRNLPEALALNAPDYRAKDPKSGQTLAQAFDNVAVELRAGRPATAQPFFEDVGGAGTTASLASAVGSSFIAGDLGGVMEAFDTSVANPIDNTQALLYSAVSDRSFSNYNAGFIALNRSFANGFQFQFNWTYSHALGNQGLNQENDYSVNSPYNLNLDYSSELFDRKDTINFWTYYELPFGHDKKYLTSGPLSRVVGGWYTSGIFTFATGLPQYISADGDYGACCGLSDGTAAISTEHLRSVQGFTNVVPTINGSKSGLPDLFPNPTGVFSTLSRPLLSQYGQIPFDELRLMPIWNIDFSIGKNLIATERFKGIFTVDFFNLLNHPFLGTASCSSENGCSGTLSVDMGSPATFGQISGQDNLPRRLLLGLRFEF